MGFFIFHEIITKFHTVPIDQWFSVVEVQPKPMGLVGSDQREVKSCISSQKVTGDQVTLVQQ